MASQTIDNPVTTSNKENIEIWTHSQNIIFSILILGMIGFLYIFNITYLDNGYNIVLKQIFYFLSSFLFFFSIFYIPKKLLELLLKNFHIVFIINILILIVGYLSPLGAKINNATRWIKLGPIYIQPSEFLKYTSVLFLIWIYEYTNFNLTRKTIFAISSIALSAILIGLAPDIGSMALTLFVNSIILFTMFPTKKIIVIPILAVVILGMSGLAFYKFSHIKKRIEAFSNPEANLQSKNYQPHQLKLSTYGSGILGEGFGNSIQKLKYLPNAFNDFILAIIIEELGILGLFAVLFIFSYLFLNITNCIKLCINRISMILLLAFLLYCFLNLCINVLVCLGLFPVKGITLPFVSLGGSFVFANLLFLGIALHLENLHQLTK